MFASPRCRQAIGFAATTLLVAEGCFTYRPTALPVPVGSELRVEGTRLQLHDGTLIRPGPAACEAARIDGRLFGARGDTLTIVPVRAMSGYRPRRACTHLGTATLIAAPDVTHVLARQFSPWRTTGAVVGTGVLLSAIALFVVVEEYAHSDASMRSPSSQHPVRAALPAPAGSGARSHR